MLRNLGFKEKSLNLQFPYICNAWHGVVDAHKSTINNNI